MSLMKYYFKVLLFLSIISCGKSGEINGQVDLDVESGETVDTIPVHAIWQNQYVYKDYGNRRIPFDYYYRSHVNWPDFYGYTSPGEVLAAYMIADTREGLELLYENPASAPYFGAALGSKQASPNNFDQYYFIIDRSFKIPGPSLDLHAVVFELAKGSTAAKKIMVLLKNKHGKFKIYPDHSLEVKQLLPFLMNDEILQELRKPIDKVDEKLRDLYRATRFGPRQDHLTMLNTQALIEVCTGEVEDRYESVCTRLLPEVSLLDGNKYWRAE
ncbi:hypothetical protein CEQ90_13355 [Lewinellaceae bacterium SD302]|nr:hypothetical protein CEQ90_13355 [Lewinellaceae bacterium SD302]